MLAKKVFLMALAVLCSLLATIANLADASCPIPARNELKYEFHATKTIYSDALNLLNARQDHLEGSFDDDSLADEHKDLLKDSCKPIVFYFIGRHSARFPDSDDIVAINKDLLDLQAKLKFSLASLKCVDRYADLLAWKPTMTPEMDNLITQLGDVEERGIASRFKRLYPDFFDTSKAKVSIAVTKKIRTAQTAVSFLQEVKGLHELDDSCKRAAMLPNNPETPSYSADKILKNECYRRLMDERSLPALWFHDQCEEILGKAPKNKLVTRIKDPSVVQPIADKVAAKLQLPAGSVSAGTLDSVYSACKFENAARNDSVWCKLLDEADVKAFEYIEDAKSYIKDAYGPEARPRQACPLVSDLVTKLSSAMNAREDNQQKSSYFYFSHAGAMKKLLAAFGVFEDSGNFSETQVDEFIKTLRAPQPTLRKFRSSLIVPFSANMAFVMYRCQKAGKPVKHKLLATVTEHPVKLGGCKDTDCNLDKFLAAYQAMQSCDLRSICKPQK